MDVEKAVLACRVEGATLVDVLMAAGAARRTRRWLCIVTTAKSQAIRSISDPF